MEQLTLSSLPSGAFIRGGQALLLQNNQNLNLSACLNGDILQQALNGINTTLPFITDFNSQKISIGESSFILDKDVGNVENNVVQLSIKEDVPFHVVNTTKTDDTIFSTDQQSILLEDILNSTSDKSDNSLDSLNSLLQLSPDNENKEISDIPIPNVKGNFTYAYQLTNGSKLSQISQNAPLTIPINSTNGLSNITPILTTSSSIDVNKATTDSQNSTRYVILKGVNIKPRLLLNVNKTSQEVVKNGTQKVQVLPAGKVLVNKTIKSSQAPTVKKIDIKETATQSSINRTVQNQEIKSKPVSLLLKSLLKPRQTDDQSSLLRTNISPSQQFIDVNGSVDVQDKLLPTVVCNVVNNQLFISQPIESNLESSELKSNGKALLGNLVSKNTVSKTNESLPEPVARCTEDQLKKIQAAYQNGELNLNKNNASSVIYDDETKIVCKLLYPEDIIQKDISEGKESDHSKKPNKRKLGRPPLDKKQTEEASQVAKKAKVSKKVKEIKLPRTRSGRLSRPPRHILKDFKKLNNDHSDISSGESEVFEEPINDDASNPKETPVTLSLQQPPMPCKIPSRYRCPTCGKKYPGRKMLLHLNRYPDHGDANTLVKLRADVNVDGNLDKDREYTCSYCRRTYMGDDMLIHLAKYRNHGDSRTVILVKNNAAKKNPYFAFKKLFSKLKHYRQIEAAPLKEFLASYKDDIFKEAVKERFSKLMTPWDYLVERQPEGEGAVKGLISDLTSILQSLPSDILIKTDSSDPNALQISDEKICRLLNISPGSYLANDSKIKPVVKIEPYFSVKTEGLDQFDGILNRHCMSNDSHKDAVHREDIQSAPSGIWPISTVLSQDHAMTANQVLEANQIIGGEQIIQTSQALPNEININQALTANQVLGGKQVLETSQVLSESQALTSNQVLSSEQVLAASEVLSSDQVLSPNPVISPSCIMSPAHDEDNLFCKDVDSSLDLDKKVPPDLSDILLDKSSMDTVDEILNDRLNELMPLDVPSLSETQALARSIFSTNSLELHAVSGSTEDLLKSLENLAPELPPVPGPTDFDFTVLSTDFVTGR